MASVIVMAFVSCAEEVDKTIIWPEWASRPIVDDAKLIGANGSMNVTAGENVVYTAKIRDDYNDLLSYELTITYDGNVAMKKKVDVSGSNADVNLEFKVPFAANLSDALVPEVTLEVLNVANGKVSKRLDGEHNITISRPDIPSELYIIDNLGGAYPLQRGKDSFSYSTKEGTNLSSLGSKFVIATAVNAGKPDFSGIVWGQGEDGLVVIDNSGNWISTPDSEGHGFKNFGFNTFSFSFDKLVNYKVTIDKSGMDSQEQSGVNYLVAARVKLVRDCEVEFVGFGALESMIQQDRFEIIGENSVKFTGHSRNWSFYYDVDDNWMILNYVNFNEPDQVWVTGENACFPLGKEGCEHSFKYLASDGKDRYATLAAVKDESGVYRCLVHLFDNYVIQLYSWVKWSTVISMTSLTPSYGEITADGHYINPGPEFTPGVYMLTIERTKNADSGGDGAVANVSLERYTL